jgi:Asp-tRNA(Asn)/Glu-tRNA(Gln) amidotransferase A subunit family amidase
MNTKFCHAPVKQNQMHKQIRGRVQWQSGAQPPRQTDRLVRVSSPVAVRRARLGGLFGDADVLLAHASPGEALVGNAYTGFSFLNGVCTMLGTPCVNVPGLKGPNGMPIGVQAIGRIGQDAWTLAAANWIALRLT